MNTHDSSSSPSSSATRPELRRMLSVIRHNPGAEVAAHARGCKDVICLNVGESDLSTPDFIVRAGQACLSEGRTFYTPPLGMPELRQELSDYHRRIYGVNRPASCFAVTPSGSAAVHLAFCALFDKGDEVIVVSPLWRNIFCSMQMQEVQIREVSLEMGENEWTLDMERLFAAVTPRTRAIVVNSPNNPTGWVMPADQIAALMDFARTRGLWVVSDEVYSRMTFGQSRAPSFLDPARPDDRLIIVNSFSKNWLMTGWRLGWLIVPEDLEKNFHDLMAYTAMCPSSIAQAGALAALREGEDFLAAQNVRYQRNVDILTEGYARIGRIETAAPPSGIYSFFRVAGEPDDVALCRRLIDEAKLALAPGLSFGQGGIGYVRLCFAVSEARLRDALGRLESVLSAG